MQTEADACAFEAALSDHIAVRVATARPRRYQPSLADAKGLAVIQAAARANGNAPSKPPPAPVPEPEPWPDPANPAPEPWPDPATPPEPWPDPTPDRAAIRRAAAFKAAANRDCFAAARKAAATRAANRARLDPLPLPPAFTDWIADRIGTRRWVAGPVKRRHRQAFERVIAPHHHAALVDAYARSLAHA